MTTKTNYWLSVAAILLFAGTMFTIILLSASPNFKDSQGSTPKRVEVVNRLPFKLAKATAVYTDDGFIYIIGANSSLGGSGPGVVLRFDVRQETVQHVGNLSSSPFANGAATYNADDRIIYYFGPGWKGVTIISLGSNEEFPKITFVATHDFLPLRANGVWDPLGRKAYVLGSSSNRDKDFIRFDPYAKDMYRGSLMATASIHSDRVVHAGLFNCAKEQQIYVIGGCTSRSSNLKERQDKVIRFNPKTESVEVTDHALPREVPHGDTVGWNEATGIAYIFNLEDITTYKASSGEISTLPFPENFIHADFGDAYVPKLNRMYVFGGYSASDVITYVQL